jgi:subtilisin family serine protease
MKSGIFKMKHILLILCLFSGLVVFTQPKDWHLQDASSTEIQGISLDKAYQLLKGKKSQTVIVAVIDSGIDIDHEDLVGKIWTNTKEVAGNGIDDDGNGYVDDVHGWNFIGSADGTNVVFDSYELTREYARLKKVYEFRNGPERGKEAEFEYWLDLKQKYQNRSTEAMKQYVFYRDVRANTLQMDELVSKFYDRPNYSKKDLDSLRSEQSDVRRVQMGLSNMMGLFKMDSISQVKAYLDQALEHFEVQVKYGYNIEYDPRKIIGDKWDDPNDRNYGNNNVEGDFADHGTHVAGIIAANRTNNIGCKGIADNVLIMPIRVVPNGDERDKDVANGIRYAADNGAQIINMSFGKSFEYRREMVDDAIDYASSKGVLFIQGAGNSNKNSDVVANYPTPIRLAPDTTHLPNWIGVGASGSMASEELVASFSNYGKKSVDLFAPGVQIYSTVPDNEYEAMDGTSMAAPVVSGVAALLMSYYPKLSAVQIRNILNDATDKFPDLRVNVPGSDKKALFSDLSISGGLLNAAKAVQLAESLSIKTK